MPVVLVYMGIVNYIPFKETDNVDYPISLYAATKKSNELMAHTYSHLFGIQTIGLRFFTVYGPWGRPDMAMFLFTDAIINNRPIKVYNNGNLLRDFTYIDDVVNAIYKTLKCKESNGEVINIGSGKPKKIKNLIKMIVKYVGSGKPIFSKLKIRSDELTKLYPSITKAKKILKWTPTLSINESIKLTVEWYKSVLNYKQKYEVITEKQIKKFLNIDRIIK